MGTTPSGYTTGGRRSPPDDRDHGFDRHPLAARLGSGVPNRVDNRPNLPPAWDQSFLGSCEGHGCARAPLPFWLPAMPTFKPSRLAAYAWGRQKGGIPLYEDSGCFTRDMLKVLQDGLYDEQVWPYDPTKFGEVPPDAERPFKIVGYTQIRTPEELTTYIAHGNCAPFTMHLPDYFDGLGAAGSTGILHPYTDEVLLDEHCMCIVGYYYDDNGLLWAIVCNSWGDLWADQGHCYILASMILDSRLGGDCWAVYPAGNM